MTVSQFDIRHLSQHFDLNCVFNMLLWRLLMMEDKDKRLFLSVSLVEWL